MYWPNKPAPRSASQEIIRHTYRESFKLLEPLIFGAVVVGVRHVGPKLVILLAKVQEVQSCWRKYATEGRSHCFIASAHSPCPTPYFLLDAEDVFSGFLIPLSHLPTIMDYLLSLWGHKPNKLSFFPISYFNHNTIKVTNKWIK